MLSCHCYVMLLLCYCVMYDIMLLLLYMLLCYDNCYVILCICNILTVMVMGCNVLINIHENHTYILYLSTTILHDPVITVKSTSRHASS